MSLQKTVELIAWDAESCQHIKRLQSQRRQCGWSWEKVDGPWRNGQLKGSKVLYWIVFSDEDEHWQDIKNHIAVYPQDEEPLQDTAKTLRAQPRSATGRIFNPIGHISLDDDDPVAATLGLDLAKEGVYWIKCLYVLTSIHGGGIGRQAMDKVENEAIEPPLNAKFLVLDTVHKDEFKREDYCLATYGEAAPKVIPHLWYERRGYEIIGEAQDFYKEKDRHGVVWSTKTVFLQRSLVR